MVDRYKSLMGSEILNQNTLARNVQVNELFDEKREIVRRTNSHATKMREHITRYKRNVGKDGNRIISDFKEEQLGLAKDRSMLKSELEKLQKHKKKDTPEYNFMKKELLRAVKSQIDLQLELNQEVTRQKQQNQKLKTKLLSSSPALANMVRDIESKKQDILYLERSIEECLQLLEIIGILTNETGEKIDLISDRVKRANDDIERAEANIDKAKIYMQKSRCKMCCIILLAVVAIIIILIVLFGFNIVGA